MRKLNYVFLVLLITFISAFVFGCGNDNGKSETDGDEVTQVCAINKVNANINYASSVESFYDIENNYYMYSLGTITNIPLETPVFYYYGGQGNIIQTFTKATTSVASVSSTVQRTVSERLKWENAVEISATVEVEMDSLYKSAVSSKISGKIGNENESTETQSYTEFQQWSETREKSVQISFDERYKEGYYAYMVSATVNVRAVVIVNRATGAVSAATYNELNSFGYTFAYNAYSAELDYGEQADFKFDFSTIGELKQPTQFVDAKGEYIQITNAKEFNAINENLNGKYVILKNIDFGSSTISPIGGEDKYFSGAIIGCGYTLSNFKIDTSISYGGLFARNKGVIKNINVANANISVNCNAKDAFVGVFVGENFGTIFNCNVSESFVSTHAIDSDNTDNSSRYSIVGGIAGKISDGSITNCTVEGLSLYGYCKKHDKGWSPNWNEAAFVYMGGIVGEHIGGMVLNCATKSLKKIEGYAEYRGNAIVPINTRSRICLGGVIGRQANSNLVQSGNTNKTDNSVFKHIFKSYNDTNGVNPYEEYKQGQIVGYIG